MNETNMKCLLEDCRANEPSKQALAIMKLQELEAFEAVPTLIELLSSPEKNVRQRAVEALGWLGNKDKKEVVGSALMTMLDDSDDMIRNEVVEALARLEYAPALEKVKYLLRHDSDWVVRASAAEALSDLAEVGNPEVLAELKLALDDPIEPVRSYAACSIGLVGTPTPDLLNTLAMYLSSEEYLATKAEILAARYRLGVREDLLKLLQLLNNDDEHLTGILLTILEDLTERKVPETLIEDLPSVQKALIQVPRSFPIFSNHVEKIIAQLEGIDIQTKLLQ